MYTEEVPTTVYIILLYGFPWLKNVSQLTISSEICPMYIVCKPLAHTKPNKPYHDYQLHRTIKKYI